MAPSSAPSAPPPMTRAASTICSVSKNDLSQRQDGKVDVNIGTVSEATSVTAVDTRASTPTLDQQQQQQQQKQQAEPEPADGQEGKINGGGHSCASTLSSPSASASASASLSSSDFDAVSSAAASASVDCSSLDLDAALIEVIAARAAAAATAAVFGRGLSAAEGGVSVDEAAAEEAASLVSSNDGDACGGEMMPIAAAPPSSRAYSVQSVEADQFSQEAIASPSVTFGTATTKKRRRSDDKGTSTKNSAATGTAVGAKKRALFYPTKKKRRVQPRSVKGDTGASAKTRALEGVVVQKQANQRQAQATTSIRGGRPPKGRVEVRTVPPTIRGIHEAARVLLASTTTVSPSLAYHPQATNSKDASTSSGSATEGILSFPTETVYTLTTCITVKPLLLRSSSTSSTSSASASEEDPSDGARSLLSTPFSVHSPSLTRLLRLKGRLPSSSTSADHGTATAAAKKQKNDTGNNISSEDDTHSSLSPPVALCSDADPALLYIHTPTQSRELVHFTKPKTFVLKPSSEPPLDVKKKGPARAAASPCESNGRPSSNSTQQSPAQVPAVTFSESREVLDRLTNAFWPGPVIVYAKCKMRKTLREKPLASIREDETSPSSVETPLSSEEDEVVYAPILPTAVLHPYRNAEPSDVVEESSEAPHDNTESPYYVGMRCPSHPLARRALEEVYSRKKQRQQHQASAGSGTSSCGGRRNRSRVVVGFNAKSSTWTACPISAKEVSSQLNGDTINLCPHEAEGTTAFIDVLNGEDEQEMFMAPTCQYGKGACVSLVVDDDAKTIHIVPPTQPKSIEGKKQEVGEQAKMSKKSNISSKDISRALKTSPRAAIEIGNSYEDVAADAEKVASRVISVVLSRWKCVEHKC